jgi:hypothetical protein
VTERRSPLGHLPLFCASVLALCTVALAAVALFVWPKLFAATPDGVAQLVTADCGPEPGGDVLPAVPPQPCAVSVLLISPGRFRVQAGDPAAERLTLHFQIPAGSPRRARILLVGASPSPDDLAVEAFGPEPSGRWRRIDAQGDKTGPGKRRLLELDPTLDVQQIRVVVHRLAGEGTPARGLFLDEVGLYASATGLGRDVRPFLTSLPDRNVYRAVLARVCLLLACLGVISSLGARMGTVRVLAPAFIFSLTLAIVLLELWIAYSPYWSVDLRVGVLTSGALQEPIGANLNYGMYLGSRLLEGKGLTFGPGWVPWERMPGYGLFNALAGVVAGFKTDLVSVGLSALKLHVLLFAVANAFFVAAARQVMRPGVAVAAAVIVVFLPHQLAYTQVDSIMVSIYLLISGALCLLIEQTRGGVTPKFRYYLLVHLGFALWFIMRADGLPTWAAMSLILHWRAWRYLALPAALYLAIGMSWGLYKYRYTGDFSMTTSSVGDVAWVGLWQVPHKFKWRTDDASYFWWMKELGLPPTSQKASDTAVREVLRFTATYPIYVGHLMLHRGLAYVDAHSWINVFAFPQLPFQALRGPFVWALLGVIALCLCLRYEERRTLYLAWPLLFNLPIFLFFFNDGPRHVAPAMTAQIVATLPPLCEAGFYRALLGQRLKALTLAAAFVAAWFLAHKTDEFLLASDRVRYWAPLLDPARLSSGLPLIAEKAMPTP